MNDSPAPSGPPPVLDYWCELQCPDCHRAQSDLQALRERYGDALEIRLRHFPLDKHKFSYTAAQAAEEAHMQGKGDAYVAAVLERAHELTERGEPVLLEVATELGLNTAEFETALIDGRHLLMVDADQAEGTALGVRGTPTYSIDGRLLDGSRSQEGLREQIEETVDRLLGR